MSKVKAFMDENSMIYKSFLDENSMLIRIMRELENDGCDAYRYRSH